MGYTEFWSEGRATFKSTETSNTIPQNVFVCGDVTTSGAPADRGAVRTDNSNAGPVLGVNSSTGRYPAGPATAMGANAGVSGVGIDVQPGQEMTIVMRDVAPVLSASGVTIAAFDKLYTTSALQGKVTNVSTSAKFVGYALEPSTGNGEIIAVKIACLEGV